MKWIAGELGWGMRDESGEGEVEKEGEIGNGRRG